MITIRIYIGSTKFLEKRFFKIEYNNENTICRRYLGLNWRYNYEEKVTKETIYEDNDDENSKEKVRQIKKEKQWVKRNMEREEI